MPVQDNLSRSLRREFAKRNVTVSDNQLAKLVSDYQTGKLKRPTNYGSAGQTPLQTLTPSKVQDDRNALFAGLGQFAWEAYESGTAGLGEVLAPAFSERLRESLGAEEDFFSADKTMAQTIGGVLGGAIGFLGPLKLIGAGTRAAAMATVGTHTAVKAGTELAAKKGLEFGLKKELGEKAVKKALDFEMKMEAGGKSLLPSARKAASVYEAGNPRAIRQFEENLGTHVKRFIMKAADKDKLSILPKQAGEVSQALIEGIREGRHINSFGRWGISKLTRGVGEEEMGRLATYVGKAIDMYINFGIYNAANEWAMAKKEGREPMWGDTALQTATFAAMLPLVEAIPGGRQTPIWKMTRDLMRIARGKPKYKNMSKKELKGYAQMVLRSDRDHSVISTVKGVDHTLTMEGVASGRHGKDVLLPFLDNWYAKRYKDFSTLTKSEIWKDMGGSLGRMTIGSLFFSGAHNLLDPEFRAAMDPSEMATHALLGAFWTKRRKPFSKAEMQKLHYDDKYIEQAELLNRMGLESGQVQTLVDLIEIGEEEGLYGAGLLKNPTMRKIKEIFDEFIETDEFKARVDTGEGNGEIIESNVREAYHSYFAMKASEVLQGGRMDLETTLISEKDLEYLTAKERTKIQDSIDEIVYDKEKNDSVKSQGFPALKVKVGEEVNESFFNMFEEAAIGFANAGKLKYQDNRGKEGGKLRLSVVSGSSGKDLGSFNEYHSLVEKLEEWGRVEKMSTKDGKPVEELTPEMKEKAADSLENMRSNIITATLGRGIDMALDPLNNRITQQLSQYHRNQVSERIYNIISGKRRNIKEQDKPLLQIFEDIFGTLDRPINDQIGSYKVFDKTEKVAEERMQDLQAAVDFAQVMAIERKGPINRISRERTVNAKDAERLHKLLESNGLKGKRVFEDTVSLKEDIVKYLWERGRQPVAPDIAAVLDMLTIGDHAMFTRETTSGGRLGIGMPQARYFEKMLLEDGPELVSNPKERKRYMKIYEKIQRRFRTISDLVIDTGDRGPKIEQTKYIDRGDVPSLRLALDKADKILSYGSEIQEPLIRLRESLAVEEDAATLATLGENIKSRFAGDEGEWSAESMVTSVNALKDMRKGGQFSEKGLKDLDIIIKTLENAYEQVRTVDDAISHMPGASRAERIDMVMNRIDFAKIEAQRERVLELQSRDIHSREEAQRVIVQMMIDGGRGVNREQVAIMLDKIRGYLTEHTSMNMEATEEQLLSEFIKKKGYTALRDYLQTVLAANQKLINPETAARYESKIAEAASAFLSGQSSVSASVNPNSVAAKYGGIMLDADTGNFSPELRERIVSAELADTESLTPARRTKLRQKGELLDVVRDMINDVVDNSESRAKDKYEDGDLKKAAGETVDQAITRHANDSVQEFILYDLNRVIGTIVDTHKPLQFTYDGQLNILRQDPDASRMRGSVEKFDRWLNDKDSDTPLNITTLAYLSSDGLDSGGRTKSIRDITGKDGNPINVENLLTDFKLTAEAGRKIQDSDKREEAADELADRTRERSTDGRWRVLSVSQTDDILYDGTSISNNQLAWSEKVGTWYEKKRESLAGGARRNFEDIFGDAIDKVQSEGKTESKNEERVLMRAMYYDFINTQGFNDLVGYNKKGDVQSETASIFKYAHLSEKRNATALNPVVENVHEKVITQYLGGNEPLALAYSEQRAKGYQANVAVVPDEVINHPLFSSREQLLRQYADARINASGEARNAYDNMINAIASNEIQSITETTSNMDGAAWLGEGFGHVVYANAGAGLGEGRGGVKPIIHHNIPEDARTLIGKENFFFDQVIANAMALHNIDIIMGESAAKSHSANVVANISFDSNLSFAENLAAGIRANHTTANDFLIPHSDVSTVFSPKALEKGRIPDALHNFMNSAENSDLIKYMKLDKNVRAVMEDAGELYGDGRNAMIAKIFNIAQKELAYKEYGSETMMAKLLNWGIDSGDILVQKQIHRMFHKQLPGRLGESADKGAGTSVFAPDPDLRLPAYIELNNQRRQIKYGEMRLPFEAADLRGVYQSNQEIPIIFKNSGGKDVSEDVVRIFTADGEPQYWNQTEPGFIQREPRHNLAVALRRLDAVLEKETVNLTAKEISDFVSGQAGPWGSLSDSHKSMWKNDSKTYTKTSRNLRNHDTQLGHISLRIPRQQMGDVVINRVKGYNNDPFSGNVVGVNSMDVLTKHQGDFDVDKLFWFANARPGMWSMALRTSGLTVEPQPYTKTVWGADIFENGLNARGSIASEGYDTIGKYKTDLNRNKRLIGRIIRMNHSLTFLENTGFDMKVGADIHKWNILDQSSPSTQHLAQRINNVASTLLDPLKGASELAFATDEQVIDFILFDRWSKAGLAGETASPYERVPGSKAFVGGERPHGVDQNGNPRELHLDMKPVMHVESGPSGAMNEAYRDVYKEVVQTVGRTQRIFSGVFDESGQRQAEYWQVRNMYHDIREFHLDPNKYIFDRLWRRSRGNSGKQNALLKMFFPKSERFQDVGKLAQSVQQPGFKYPGMAPVLSFGVGREKPTLFQEFMDQSPGTYVLHELGKRDMYKNPEDVYGFAGELKNIGSLNRQFLDNVSLLRASKDPGQELNAEEMGKIWDNILGLDWGGHKIGGVELNADLKRDIMWQIIESDRQQIEGYMDYLHSERWVNETRIDRLLRKHKTLKTMESYFKTKSMRDYWGKDVEPEERDKHWAKISVRSHKKGHFWRNEGYENQVIYRVKDNITKRAEDTIGRGWDQSTLKGLEQVPEGFDILFDGIVRGPKQGMYMKPGLKYVVLKNPIRSYHTSDFEAQDGLSALNALTTYNPESFRVPLASNEVERFYNDVDTTYRSIKRITTQTFRDAIENKATKNEIYTKGGIDINSWLEPLFREWGQDYGFGKNAGRIQDIYESLIQPEVYYGRIITAGEKVFPFLKQNVRVVNAINRWMLEQKDIAYSDAVQAFVSRKGILLRRARTLGAGETIDELSDSSREYTRDYSTDFNELGGMGRLVHDIIKDPLGKGYSGTLEMALDAAKPSWDVSRNNKNRQLIRMIDGSEQVHMNYAGSEFNREGGVNVRNGLVNEWKTAIKKEAEGNACVKGIGG